MDWRPMVWVITPGAKLPPPPATATAAAVVMVAAALVAVVLRRDACTMTSENPFALTRL